MDVDDPEVPLESSDDSQVEYRDDVEAPRGKRPRKLKEDVGIRQQQRRRAEIRTEVGSMLAGVHVSNDWMFQRPSHNEQNNGEHRLVENQRIEANGVVLMEPVELFDDESDVQHECFVLAPDSPQLNDPATLQNQSETDSLADDYSSTSSFGRFDEDFSADEDERIDFDNSDKITEEQEEFQTYFCEALIRWVFDYNVTKSAVSALLRLLTTLTIFSFLPRTYKTLLKTPRTTHLEEMKPGKYFHAGFREAIIESLENMQLSPDSLEIFINIDGVPLTESSRSDFWPILGRFYLPTEGKPFVIGVYHGRGKPENFNGFLQKFVDEANDLIVNGLYFNGKKISITISAFVCDLPALASIKSIASHSGHYSCIKCVTEGTYVHNRGNKRGGRVTFPQLDAELRTDESFRQQSHKDHHTGRSVLEQLPISMVDHFPHDPMHNLFIGVTRKLLNIWNSGRKLITVRLPKSCMDYISNRLVEISASIPCEFARKTRGLDELSRFKATELRLLLLYILPIVLSEGEFPKELYHHFLLLHCAIRSLSCPELVRNVDNIEYARRRIIDFVKGCSELYGDQFISSNIHNLIHLPDAVIRFRALMIFSCFPFEDFLNKLVGLVRPCGNPLPQLANRILEIRANPCLSKNNQAPTRFDLMKEHCHGPMISRLDGVQYEGMVKGSLKLSISPPNNCVIMNSGEHVFIENFVLNANREVFLIGRKFLNLDNLYDYPMASKKLGECVAYNLSERLESWNINLIKFKAIKTLYKHNSEIQKFAIASELHCDTE